jgi:hypothetical protein
MFLFAVKCDNSNGKEVFKELNINVYHNKICFSILVSVENLFQCGLWWDAVSVKTWETSPNSFLFVLLVQGMLSYNAGYHCLISNGYVFSAVIF